MAEVQGSRARPDIPALPQDPSFDPPTFNRPPGSLDLTQLHPLLPDVAIEVTFPPKEHGLPHTVITLIPAFPGTHRWNDIGKAAWPGIVIPPDEPPVLGFHIEADPFKRAQQLMLWAVQSHSPANDPESPTACVPWVGYVHDQNGNSEPCIIAKTSHVNGPSAGKLSREVELAIIVNIKHQGHGLGRPATAGLIWFLKKFALADPVTMAWYADNAATGKLVLPLGPTTVSSHREAAAASRDDDGQATNADRLMKQAGFEGLFPTPDTVGMANVSVAVYLLRGELRVPIDLPAKSPYEVSVPAAKPVHLSPALTFQVLDSAAAVEKVVGPDFILSARPNDLFPYVGFLTSSRAATKAALQALANDPNRKLVVALNGQGRPVGFAVTGLGPFLSASRRTPREPPFRAPIPPKGDGVESTRIDQLFRHVGIKQPPDPMRPTLERLYGPSTPTGFTALYVQALIALGDIPPDYLVRWRVERYGELSGSLPYLIRVDPDPSPPLTTIVNLHNPQFHGLTERIRNFTSSLTNSNGQSPEL